MCRAWILLVLSFIPAMTIADEAAMKKYKDLTPTQIKALPEKIVRSELPMAYSFAAQKGLASDSELLFGMWLNTLMYPAVSDYQASVKSFQTDLNDKPTGILTVWQIHNLEIRSGMQKLGTVFFPNQFSSWQTKELASVQGTMKIIDERIAWPINHIKLNCYKTDSYCELNRISLNVPDESSWSINYQLLEDSPTIYKITKWTENIIEAEPQETGELSHCRSESISLNFKTKEFYSVTRNGTEECKILDTTFPRLTKPRIAQIVDGKSIFEEEFSSIQKRSYGMLSSDFRRRVDAASTAN